MLSVVRCEGCRRCKILWADRDGAERDVAPVPSKPAVKHHTYTSLEGLNISCRNRSVVIVIVRTLLSDPKTVSNRLLVSLWMTATPVWLQRHEFSAAKCEILKQSRHTRMILIWTKTRLGPLKDQKEFALTRLQGLSEHNRMFTSFFCQPVIAKCLTNLQQQSNVGSVACVVLIWSKPFYPREIGSPYCGLPL